MVNIEVLIGGVMHVIGLIWSLFGLQLNFWIIETTWLIDSIINVDIP